MTGYRHSQKNLSDYVVVDLAPHAEKLLAYEDISDDLSEEAEFQVIEYVRSLGRMSYDKIERRYPAWLEADRAHDVYVDPETTKFREKVVISDTRAIADTVLTYLMAALAGRNPMFQIEGLNSKSRKAGAIMEKLLHQHMRRTAGEAKIAQLLLDSIRYGMAPTKISWNPNKKTNDIINFDPRRVFPDPRVSWGDWDNMQYIIFTTFTSTTALVASGMYPKIQKYPELLTSKNLFKSATTTATWPHHQFAREEGKGFNVDPNEPYTGDSTRTSFALSNARVTDECWVRLQGYEVNLPQIEQIWLVMTVLDEEAIIRFQLSPNGRQFPCVIGGLYNDTHKTYSQSLYDLMMPLHDISTWLLRSRVDNVQAALNNLIFADPTRISIPDLIDRNPWGIVRTMPGVQPGEGIYIAQVPDVTRSHWNDIAAIGDLKQRVSAASDAQQGMPTTDSVRTATEIARLTQLGSQRLGVLARTLSGTTIRPAVTMMIDNLQDAVSLEGSIKMMAGESPGLLTDMVKDDYVDFNVQDLQGDLEYLVVDGTLPIEPTRNAETWLNILQIVNNTGLNMEYDAGRMVEEAIRAMGVSDLDQFKISEEQKAGGMTPSQQLSIMEKMRGASVQPTEDVAQEVQKGNLVPMSQAGG
jgi:hypothetical protein